MIRQAALLASLMLAVPAIAADGPKMAARADAKLARLTAGRVAGAPVRCIQPDRGSAPEKIGGRALVFRQAGTLYVSQLRDGCPWLRENRTIVTSSINGHFCRNDQVRIVDLGTLFGVCRFGDFTPYTKAR